MSISSENFNSAAELIEQNLPIQAHSPEAELLTCLGYIVDGTNLAEHSKNIASLLRIAARCEDIFRLPLPHSKNMYAFGARISPDAFGIPNHPTAGAGGRGLSLINAFESCMGEVAEYLSFIERPADALLQARNLGPQEGTFDLDWAISGLKLRPDIALEEIDWIAVQSLNSETKDFCPSELVLRCPKNRQLSERTAESTGVSAGRNWNNAVYSGLMEVIERDAFALWWHGGASGKVVSKDALFNSGFQKFATNIRADNSRNWWLIKITTDLDIPAYACVSGTPNGSEIVVGCAASIDEAGAAKGAFLEMCQMELAQSISIRRYNTAPKEKLNQIDLLWVKRYNELSTSSYPELLGHSETSLSSANPNGPNLELAIEKLVRKNFEVFSVDLTRTEINVPVCKILVPGLQSSKPDWITQRLLTLLKKSDRTQDDVLRRIAPI